MSHLVYFLIGWLFGFYTRRAYGIARAVFFKLKIGVCFRYKPTGFRVNRNGTVSDFCQRCGHPQGYHGFNQ